MLTLCFAPVLTDFFPYSFSVFHVVPVHKLLMAIVAVVITKIHNVTPVPSPERTNWGGTGRNWMGTKIYWTFAYKNWFSYLVRLQVCAILKIRHSCLEKQQGRRCFLYSLFPLRPIIAWKTYLQQRMLLDRQPEFCWNEWTKSTFFFAENLSELGFVLKKLMQLKRVTGLA